MKILMPPGDAICQAKEYMLATLNIMFCMSLVILYLKHDPKYKFNLCDKDHNFICREP
jgi:hypothetical protein